MSHVMGGNAASSCACGGTNPAYGMKFVGA